ncbi:hypothetical protein ACFSKW_54790 [Nonomuraea mangrovi]|uniref:Uncharacterized protein n=1 Tax=Nonomuraea mangrovi TaxID=2316207 RepID=A0ABW4THY5_9ACTN
MSTIRRTTWHPLGRPTAGELTRIHPAQVPAVPISFGNGEDLILDDPAWARDLATAVAAAASVLESEHGLPAAEPYVCDDSIECVHEAARGQAVEERDAYRDILTRIAEAQSLNEVRDGIRDARLALEHWANRA